MNAFRNYVNSTPVIPAIPTTSRQVGTYASTTEYTDDNGCVKQAQQNAMSGQAGVFSALGSLGGSALSFAANYQAPQINTNQITPVVTPVNQITTSGVQPVVPSSGNNITAPIYLG